MAARRDDTREQARDGGQFDAEGHGRGGDADTEVQAPDQVHGHAAADRHAQAPRLFEILRVAARIQWRGAAWPELAGARQRKGPPRRRARLLLRA